MEDDAKPKPLCKCNLFVLVIAEKVLQWHINCKFT